MADRVPALFAPECPLIGFFDRLARPLLRALDPEDAHSLAVKALEFAPRDGGLRPTIRGWRCGRSG